MSLCYNAATMHMFSRLQISNKHNMNSYSPIAVRTWGQSLLEFVRMQTRALVFWISKKMITLPAKQSSFNAALLYESVCACEKGQELASSPSRKYHYIFTSIMTLVEKGN